MGDIHINRDIYMYSAYPHIYIHSTLSFALLVRRKAQAQSGDLFF